MLQDDTLSLETYVKEKNDKCVSSETVYYKTRGGYTLFYFLQTQV